MFYNIFAYATFYYNPKMKLFISVPLMILISFHAICAITSVFLTGDGTKTTLYPKKNYQTIIQRVSGILMLPMLIIHINSFELLKQTAQNQQWLFLFIIISESLFYGLILDKF